MIPKKELPRGLWVNSKLLSHDTQLQEVAPGLRGAPGIGDLRARRPTTVDDLNPALPIIRTIPSLPEFGVHKVMQYVKEAQNPGT